MSDSPDRPFSWAWVVLSVVVFLSIELMIGGLVPSITQGRFIGHVMTLRIEFLMMMLSYFAGGFVIGLVSPGRRLAEPAVGAAISVAFTFGISFVTPVIFFHADPSKVFVGMLLGGGVALYGAHWGEKLSGN